MAAMAGDAVAVIGAAGQTGRAAIAELQRRGGIPVRALIRRREQAGLFAEAVDCRVADLDDRASLSDALRGVGALLYIPPVFESREEAFGANVIAAAEASGCRHILYHSVLHAATPDMPHHARKARVELHLRHSSLTWTIIQPAMYAETVLAFFDADRARLAPGLDVTRPFNPVALRDLAEVSATILTQPGYDHATYELAGPDRLDVRGMAACLSRLIGRPIYAENGNREEIVASVSNRLGFGSAQAAELRAMLDHYDRHGLVGNAGVLGMLLGRPPTSFADALHGALTNNGLHIASH
ncbi:SDR family oxidoreductase [Sphingomonas sp. Root720]|uniref:SDR family oxidoreductase n=2 Tax=Sphingomonas TaxID=13687 RepID=UPI0006FCC189|nr:NmrA family NAD(P)-binding protein [Sphingomonas sp. Root720]KQX23379.1 hypothetical protein ASD17_03490 [Sphingomonas sp. Root1294]KQY68230.1 hypothetical protein ASD39_06010 [Sphingomonas sp. Root50]KRB91127.1 hypothetical protein ASE22_12810 [Sphingomonas sp. Root720]